VQHFGEVESYAAVMFVIRCSEIDMMCPMTVRGSDLLSDYGRLRSKARKHA
jgi:hypothetical protein